MIINPAIVALLGASLLTVGVAVYASVIGAQIVRQWDLSSGSQLQLQLEKRTYLISTIMAWLLSVDIFSLFLMIYTADRLHPMFVGAMCAAGTFHVNAYGYPALMVKIVSVVCCGIWMILNQVDNQAEDYPLIRAKYILLFVTTAILTLGALLSLLYFKGLSAGRVTTCCGTLFSSQATSIAGDIAALPVGATRIVFFAVAAVHTRATIHLLVTGRGARATGWASAAYFIVALAAVISFISVYYYALPTHHCPFDLLQADYHYIGYPLYASLFTCGITGMGVGVLQRFAAIDSLRAIIPAVQRRYAWVSLAGGLIFLGIVLYPMIFSPFTLGAV